MKNSHAELLWYISIGNLEYKVAVPLLREVFGLDPSLVNEPLDLDEADRLGHVDPCTVDERVQPVGWRKAASGTAASSRNARQRKDAMPSDHAAMLDEGRLG